MGPRETSYLREDASNIICPIQYVQTGNQPHVPAPLVRITTCGGLKLEVLQKVAGTDHPQGCYHAVTLQQRPKGSSTGLILLKVLASLPDHYASKDWLTEHLPRNRNDDDDEEWGRGLVRVDNVVYLLRRLLCPSGIVEEETTRKALVTYVRNHRESGPGYRLTSTPLLWLDIDIIAISVKQAVLLEQQGKESLACWEQAYALASKGGYLPEEAYSDWAKDKRIEIEGYLRQAVHALRRLYLVHYSKEGEEQVLAILRTYWYAHPTDEDILRPLMELLGKRGYIQEATDCYHRLCERLELEGRTPDQRTQKTAQNIRVGESQYEQTSTKTFEFANFLNASSSSLANQQGMFTPFSYDDATQSFMKYGNSFPVIGQTSKSELLNPTSTSLSIPSLFRTDGDVLAHLSMVLSKPSVVDEREITYFDQQTRLYWRAREETSLPATTLYTSVIRHIDELTILLARSHLPILRSYLCETICRTVLLAGILLYDVGQYTQARQQYQVAFQAATEANNPVLQAIVWGWMSFTWTYAKHYTEALRCVQHARSFATRTTDIVAQAWLAAIESEIQAHLCNSDACLLALSDMECGIGSSPFQDTSYLFEFNPALLLGYKGVCLQQFYHRQKPATHSLLREAKEALEQALTSETPLKRKLYYLSDLAGVYARQGEVETACTYVVQSIPLIMQVGSGSKTIRKHLLQVRALLQPNEHTSFVRALDEQMAPLLIGMQTKEV